MPQRGICLLPWYFLRQANTTQYGIPKDKYPCDGGKAEKLRIGKTNTPFINQSEGSIHI
jgi:hypothetical protein